MADALFDRALELVMDAGQTLLENGGEVFRAQQTMEIMAASLGVRDFHVYVLTNGIFASAHLPGRDAVSLVRHVPTVSVHLGRVEAVNELSRELAAGRLGVVEAEARLNTARTLPRSTPQLEILACVVGSAGFAYLFGGTLADMPVAAVAGLLEALVCQQFARHGINRIFTDIVAAFTAAQEAASATVKLLKNVTIPQNADSHSYGIRLKSGDITLDLNGCTIQTTGGESGFVPLYAVFYIENGSSLTVQNSIGGGKIVQPNGGQAIHVGSNGTLTVESGVTIEVTSNDESSFSSSAPITDKNCAVFLNGGGTANILGGTLTGKQGIYVKNGTLSVSGGTIYGKNSYALQVAQDAVATNDSKVQLSGGSYTTGVSDGCSIWNADGPAAALLASGYRYQDESGKESAYSSENNNGVVGDTTVAVRPANEFSYVDANGKEQTQADCTVLTADGFQGALAGNETWFAAKGNVTANDPLQVYGTVNLILCDGVTVTLNEGIALNGQYTQPATLNIYAQSGGTGTLICSGPSDSGCAGIYDNSNEDGNETASR